VIVRFFVPGAPAGLAVQVGSACEEIAADLEVLTRSPFLPGAQAGLAVPPPSLCKPRTALPGTDFTVAFRAIAITEYWTRTRLCPATWAAIILYGSASSNVVPPLSGEVRWPSALIDVPPAKKNAGKNSISNGMMQSMRSCSTAFYRRSSTRPSVAPRADERFQTDLTDLLGCEAQQSLTADCGVATVPLREGRDHTSVNS
jgi:hypothetical protein